MREEKRNLFLEKRDDVLLGNYQAKNWRQEPLSCGAYNAFLRFLSSEIPGLGIETLRPSV